MSLVNKDYIKIIRRQQELSSCGIVDILIKYNELGVDVKSVKLNKEFCRYDNDTKTLLVDTEFDIKDRKNKDLSYILLFGYYLILDAHNGSLRRDLTEDLITERATVYAGYVFLEHGDDIPHKFELSSLSK